VLDRVVECLTVVKQVRLSGPVRAFLGPTIGAPRAPYSNRRRCAQPPARIPIPTINSRNTAPGCPEPAFFLAPQVASRPFECHGLVKLCREPC
jgi:hypothetical protein